MNQQVKDGYYGMVVDLVSFRDDFITVINEVGGSYLFYHVAKDRHTADQIIQECNRIVSVIFIANGRD